MEKIQEFEQWKDVPHDFTGKCKVKYCETIRHYLNGSIHRLDGSAIESPNGERVWYKYGALHRLNGPAVEYANGKKYWYKEGKLHRLDGPAIERPYGEDWWVEGKMHRLDGSAIERPDGQNSWYVEGKEYSEEKFNALPEVIMYRAGL